MRNLIRTPLILLVIIVMGNNEAMSQELLSSQQLREDFELFRTALQEAHPGLYRYNSREHLDSVFAKTDLLLNRDMTQQEFYRILVPVITGIKCGHTKFHPDNNWTDNYYFGKDKLFPLKLVFINKKAYILYSYSGNEIPIGAEIVSINKKPLSEIVDILFQGLFSDGSNTTFKFIELSKFFSAVYANLIGSPDKFEIQFMVNDKSMTSVLPAVSYEILVQKEKELKEGLPVTEPYSLSLTGNGIGLMTIRTFAYDAKEKYKQFLKWSFIELENKGISDLIIDLRDNEGGKDARGAMLLSYLMDRSFRYYDHLQATTDDKYSFSENAYLPKFYGLLRMLLTHTDSGVVLWKHNKNLKVQKPRKNNFKGRVYVLINGASFSVTSEFAAVTHYFKRAVFIGEETGGGYYGNNSGTFVIAKLPNSKLNMGIPMLAYYVAVKDFPYSDRGVIPDYQVSSSIDDLINRKDAVLAFTLEMIEKRNIVP
jgi:C-terminal processing protease CtpA/Prc